MCFLKRRMWNDMCWKRGSNGSSEIFNWDEPLNLSILPIEVKLHEIFEKEIENDVRKKSLP